MLGARRLEGVTSLDVQAVVSAVVDRGLSPATVRRARNVLSSALDQAVRWRLLVRNPVDQVDVPRQVRREMLAMDLEQARKFLVAADLGPHGTLFAFALATGMRPSEYMGLRWQDIDFEGATAAVRRTLTRPRASGGYAFEEPKTPKSRRLVPLPAALVKRLRDHRRTVLATRLRVGEKRHDLDLVFPGPHGEPLHEHNLRVFTSCDPVASMGVWYRSAFLVFSPLPSLCQNPPYPFVVTPPTRLPPTTDHVRPTDPGMFLASVG